MKTNATVTRWITAGLLAVTALSFASTAFADHGRSRRFKGAPGGYGGGYGSERVIVRERSSSAGPAIAGLIGGFILGSAINLNAHPVVVHERHYYPARPVVVYRYYDPYGDDWYDSLDQCEFRHGGPRIIQVIDIRSGREVRRLRYRDGHWNRMSGDYDERDFDRRGSDRDYGRYDEDDD